jgi:hypothetical protein
MAHDMDCRVCLVEHDEEIHEATLRVRSWFKEEVTLGLFDYVEEQEKNFEAA